MRTSNNLIQRTTEFAMHIVRAYVQPWDIAIDATCGNGHDTLRLARMLQLRDSAEEDAQTGRLFAFDIQRQAIHATEELLIREGYADALGSKITLTCLGHEDMKEYFRSRRIPSEGDGFAGAIIFNLGYLPGGDKSLTTKTGTTLTAVRDALTLLRRDGLLCVTMYGGHAEGANEKRALLAFAEELDPGRWHVSYINMLNQKQSPPEILLISRKR